MNTRDLRTYIRMVLLENNAATEPAPPPVNIRALATPANHGGTVTSAKPEKIEPCSGTGKALVSCVADRISKKFKREFEDKNLPFDFFNALVHTMSLMNDLRFSQIDAGSSRLVFDIGDNKVIKFATKEAGIEQNTAEFYTSEVDPELSINVYGAQTKKEKTQPEYYWVIAEKVTPAKSEKDLEAVIGIPWKYVEYRLVAAQVKAEGANKKDIDDLLSGYGKKIEKIDKKVKAGKHADANKFIEKLSNLLVKGELLLGDTVKVGSWGVTGDGKLKIFDFGLSTEKFKKYYLNIAFHVI